MHSEQYLAEYLRLSIEDGDSSLEDGDSPLESGDAVSGRNESQSIAHQRKLISDYREEKGLYLDRQVLEFVDDGYSGTNFDRPAVRQLLSLVREGRICCIIVKDISRFGRNFLEVGDYLEQIFPFMGVRFIAINDGYDSNDYDGTTGGIELAFRNLLYDMYSKDLSVKMCSALEIRRKRGDFIGPRPPFGYQFGSCKKKLEIDPEAAGTVKKIFRLAGQGYSTGQIAVRLNEERIPTPGQYKNGRSGKEEYHMLRGKGYWDRKMVLKILQNKVYLGIVENAKNKVTEIGGKHFKRVPDEERICVSGMHDPVITEEEFHKASNAIKERGAQKGKKHCFDNRSVLSGKLKCKNCGKSLVRIACTTVPCYTCERSGYEKESGCFAGRLKEPDVEAEILECICQKMKLKHEESEKKPVSPGTGSIPESKGALQTRLDALKAKKQALYEDYKLERISRGDYAERVGVLREETVNLQEQMERMRLAEQEEKERVQGTWAAEGLTRELVDRYIDRVDVDREGKLELVWKDGRQA